MDQRRAPLFEKMIEHYFQRNLRLHVPGHAGKVSNDLLERQFFEQIRHIDYTEVGELDDLHHPAGVIAEAQKLAADAFGAEETWFLVNGSTVGNQAMIMGTVSEGELLLVQRNCHKSVLNGLKLAGARAVFLSPMVDDSTGLSCGVHPDQIKEALSRYPEARGVLLTNPNYYGMNVDLGPIAKIIHRHGIPLLVDEAHGAHYGFHPSFPRSALSNGADAVVQSTHKMLTAMTMGAMLHLQGSLVNRARFKQILSMLQTSSPSYPIMASLDLARKMAVIEGKQLLDKSLKRSQNFRQWVRDQTPLASIEHTDNAAWHSLDPLKITLWDRRGKLTGFELQAWLQRYRCLAEMADAQHVLLQFGLYTDDEDVSRLKTALTNISVQTDEEKKEIDKPIENIYRIPPIPTISLPVSFHLQMSSGNPEQRISLADAIGRRSAGMVIPYPPGIPILYDGEMITEWIAAYLQILAENGAVFQGLEHVREYGIPVLKEDDNSI